MYENNPNILFTDKEVVSMNELSISVKIPFCQPQNSQTSRVIVNRGTSFLSVEE